jgi:hypothetical protein
MGEGRRVVPLKAPRWDSRWDRPVAALELLAQPVLIPLSIAIYGLAELRRGQLAHVVSLLKIIRTGKQGPSAGIVW